MAKLTTFSAAVALCASGCTGDAGGRDTTNGSSITTITSTVSGTGATGSGGTSTTGESGTATSSASSADTTATSSGNTGNTTLKFDIGDQPDVPAGDSGDQQGCQKIDFLFVVDNSGSMADEQQSLANSFPGFISSIQNTVMAQDYHIMVIDSDADASDQCAVLCQFLPDCNGIPCNMLPPPPGGCDVTLGAGIMKNPSGQDCGFTSGERYMLENQPNLSQTFECAALVGTAGDGNERSMEAMVTSVTTENAANACNEGFLRDDAILVVTFITDEEDNGKSMGTPATWKADLVAAKNGDENAIVVLGLIGDTDQPNAVCTADLAEASPNLRTFAESFPYGSWGSICTLDYAPFFDQAVMVIDNACDDFEPPG